MYVELRHMVTATTVTNDEEVGGPGKARPRGLRGTRPPGTLRARTRQVAAFDALQVRVHPEELAQRVVHHQGHRADEAGGKEDLTFGAVQGRALDLGRRLLHVGEVQVPAGRGA